MRDFRGAGRNSRRGFFIFGSALGSFCIALLISGCAGLIQSASPGNNGGGSLSISNVTTSNATSASIMVNWQTSSPATSQVEYGTTTNYGSLTAVDPAMVTTHQVSVTNLKPGTTYHCRVHSTDANNQTAISGDFSCATAADTTPPTVTISSPTANSTVSGTVNVSANASDNVAVASVQFKVDGANTGPAIPTAPYTYALNTKTLSDGNHVLTAVATDTSGNSATSAGVTVTVNNAISGPTITSLSPTSGLVGVTVTITGTNFGATQGTSTVKFNGTSATPTSWSATSIVAAVPTGATTGSVVVAVGGVSSNGVNFTVTTPAPSITGLSPVTGVIGTTVTITGANFGASQGTSTVTFNGAAAAPTSWSATSIVAPVPTGASTGNVVVTVGGVASNGVNFTITSPAPSITSLSPTSGLVGAAVTITGTNFGATQGTSTVKFNGTAATPTSWSATSIVAAVPTGASTGNVVVTVGGVASNGVSFTVTSAAPSITSLSPTSGLIGAAVTITGTNFGATQGTSTVKFNGTAATPTSWSATSIVAAVPTGATTGSVVVTVAGVASNGVSFTVTSVAPGITSLSPTAGLVGAAVTITGTNFGATQGTSAVKFNGTAATPTSWSATSIVAAVPAGATTGNVVVTVGGVASNGVSFTVTTPAPSILSLSPTSGAVGTSVTIAGANFGATQGTSTVTFNGTAATPTSWSTTSIVAPVPTGATTGNVVVTVGGVTSNGVSFTVSTGSGTGATGPLRALAGNPYYFTDGSGKAILLTGSQTWDDFQDMGNAGTPPAFDFNAFVTFLKSHGQNATILWRKDLPTYCGWGAGGTWQVGQFPWLRTGGSTGTQVASDGLPAFDLTQFDPAYFSRLRARVIQLQQNGIYAIVELFDGLGLTNNRCSNDGYPFTGGNNVNGVDDGGGTNSMTMTSTNTITGYQDAYVQHVIDALNDQPNVLWEISEEAPDNSTWWQGHMISLIHTYEAGKPLQHPVGFPSLNVSGASDSTLYNSNADWVAPMATVSPTSSCGSGTPACKVNINDSDHSFYYPNFLDSSGNVQNQAVRNYVWENFANGSQVLFMDPYEIYWTAGNRNLCPSPLGGICSGPDSKYDNFRDNLGYTLNYANRMDLAKMTPHGGLTNTGFCLAQIPATGAEYLVYAPNGGNITLNLSNTTRTMNVEWFNPVTGTASSGGTVTGGSTLTFTPPFSGDAVLYVVDAAGHN